MNEIQRGLYEVEETLPCKPGQLRFLRYMLIPSNLGDAEQQEAAARILFFSQQLDRWVGVSWLRIVEMMQEDEKIHQTAMAELRRLVLRVFRERRIYWILSVLTIGIYALFAKKPAINKQEVPWFPLSGIFVKGPDCVITGLERLSQNGYMRQEEIGKGEETTTIFFPTPKLISHVMEVQKVAPAV